MRTTLKIYIYIDRENTVHIVCEHYTEVVLNASFEHVIQTHIRIMLLSFLFVVL